MKPRPANPKAISDAAQLLKQGRLVAFPTETVYGLGADAANPEAVAGIFAAKGRPADHPLIVHLVDAALMSVWAVDIPDAAWALADTFWPGPLAIVLRKQASVPLAVTGGQDTVALRVPNHPVALALLQAFGGGLAAPSANRFCRISPTQAVHVAEELGDAVAMILDGGACQVGVESTIVDLSGPQPRLLRPGQISVAAIEAVLQQPLLMPEAEVSEVRAPGMMAVHYAPQTLALLCTPEQLLAQAYELLLGGQRVGVLAYSQRLPAHSRLHEIVMPESADAYAQALYASLRELDGLLLNKILVEQPPQTEAWRAVNDRLSKATLAVG